MELTRNHMTQYLLLFCRTFEERDAEEARLDALTDEALCQEFTAEYNAMQGAAPSKPLYDR
ncbi:hypothetical protein ACEVJL_03795 [Pseudoflavonifractor sp. P01025]|uniref:hypothetical protein n=1 Tax=Flintibacter porci TaxID=3342383 RepID=UPI0035B636A5